MARWITVREPFDFTWPSRAITAFKPGELFVKDEVADYAVPRFATEGKADGSEARSVKGKTRKQRRATKAVKEPVAAQAADHGRIDGVDQPHLPHDGRSGDRSTVDSDAK